MNECQPLIDGTTPLDQRETAITEFNAPGSKKFIFLLSIRAAGRGLHSSTSQANLSRF